MARETKKPPVIQVPSPGTSRVVAPAELVVEERVRAEERFRLDVLSWLLAHAQSLEKLHKKMDDLLQRLEEDG